MGWWTIRRNNVHRHIITHNNKNIQYNEYDTWGGLSHSVSWFHVVPCWGCYTASSKGWGTLYSNLFDSDFVLKLNYIFQNISFYIPINTPGFKYESISVSTRLIVKKFELELLHFLKSSKEN